VRDRRPLALVGAILLAGAVWELGSAGVIAAKAEAAQWLIRRAWAEARATGAEVRPWPWADTRAVARLIVPARGVDLIVLASAAGRTLAFAPGHLDGTALPGFPGTSLVAGHRDTHFRFLDGLPPNTEVRIERLDGRSRIYRTEPGFVLDTERERLAIASGTGSALVLSTCYPFDAVTPGGPLRYIVVARAEATPSVHRR
jgi:sortase A